MSKRVVKHKLVKSEEGNVLITTISNIPVNKKVKKRMEQLNKLGDTLLNNVMLTHKEVECDTEIKQTSVNLNKMYASVTERVENGLTLKAISYQPDIDAEINKIINKMKEGK